MTAPPRVNPWLVLSARISSVVLSIALGVPLLAEAEPTPGRAFPYTVAEQDLVIEKIAASPARQFKPVGHTSVVFRMRTRARVTAALKVRSRQVQRGYQYEIAAYRIARALGLDNVPPAVSRSATKREIKQRFHKERLERWGPVRRAILWEDGGSVPGAAIFWIHGLRPLKTRKGTWMNWLQQSGSIPKGREQLAADLSSMVVFDFLIGNWDRYSGGNLQTTQDGSRAYMRDHDRAFSAPLSSRRFDRLLDDLQKTELFSESLVRELAALDGPTLRRALAADPSHQLDPLLTELQIAELLDRRDTVLSHVAALSEERGQDAVLVFP